MKALIIAVAKIWGNILQFRKLLLKLINAINVGQSVEKIIDIDNFTIHYDCFIFSIV